MSKIVFTTMIHEWGGRGEESGGAKGGVAVKGGGNCGRGGPTGEDQPRNGEADEKDVAKGLDEAKREMGLRNGKVG